MATRLFGEALHVCVRARTHTCLQVFIFMCQLFFSLSADFSADFLPPIGTERAQLEAASIGWRTVYYTPHTQICIWPCRCTCVYVPFARRHVIVRCFYRLSSWRLLEQMECREIAVFLNGYSRDMIARSLGLTRATAVSRWKLSLWRHRTVVLLEGMTEF